MPTVISRDRNICHRIITNNWSHWYFCLLIIFWVTYCTHIAAKEPTGGFGEAMLVEDCDKKERPWNEWTQIDISWATELNSKTGIVVYVVNQRALSSKTKTNLCNAKLQKEMPITCPLHVSVWLESRTLISWTEQTKVLLDFQKRSLLFYGN